MTLQEAAEALQGRVSGKPPLGRTLKFATDVGALVIEGNGAENKVSTMDMPADCTVSISLHNLVELFHGRLNPTMAFMTGKVKVAGDMSVAMRLGQLVR